MRGRTNTRTRSQHHAHLPPPLNLNRAKEKVAVPLCFFSAESVAGLNGVHPRCAILKLPIMKTHLLRSILLVATLASLLPLSAAAAAPGNPGIAYSRPVGSVERYGQPLFTRGSPVSHVERALGAPYRKLSDDVWVYTNFHGESHVSDLAHGQDCSTLLVTFTNGRVSDLNLINERAQQIIAARLRAKASETTQIAAK